MFDPKGNVKYKYNGATYGNIGNTRRRTMKQKHNTICVGHHYTPTNTKNVNNN
jgi:hypothetical protein